MTSIAIRVFALGAACAISGSALAQGRHVFDLDTTAAPFTFTGNVTVSGISSPIQGTPGSFTAAGAASLDLTDTAGALTSGQLVAGNGTVVQVPALSAIIPNPLPFLPPLATITVTSVDLVFSSNSFPIGGGGAFSTSVVATMLSGTATVTGLVNTSVPLAGVQGTATTVSGTVTPNATGLRITVPINSTFPFADPASGASGSLTLVGTIVARGRQLATDVDAISMAVGGTQTMTLSAGTANAGSNYLVLGTASGTAPGFSVGSVPVPLNVDGWTIQTASSPNTPPLGGTFGTFDAIGIATATFSMPPLPILAGLQFHHAYVVFSGSTVLSASNPVGLALTP